MFSVLVKVLVSYQVSQSSLDAISRKPLGMQGRIVMLSGTVMGNTIEVKV